MLKIITTLSLRTKLIIVYVFILGAGGLITSFIGSLIVNQTIMNQAKSKVHHDLMTTYMVYNNQLMQIKNSIHQETTGKTIQKCLIKNNKNELIPRLEQIINDIDLDFLSITDKKGRVILRTTQKDRINDDVSHISVIKAALSGKSASATEILSVEILTNENPQLATQAKINITNTPTTKPSAKNTETSGMVLIAASPILDENGTVLGVLYGGHLLNNDFTIVDNVWELFYKGEDFHHQNIGIVTISLQDLCISTNVRNLNNDKVLGTRISSDVYNDIINNNSKITNNTLIVNDWYISEYQAIKNYNDEIIGALYVGILEKAYTAIRNRVVLTFLGVASIGFLLIVLISYLITKSVTRPLEEMVTATQLIATGDLNQKVSVISRDEIGKLGSSINIMAKSLSLMHQELEEWGKTLEQKVKARTDELKKMQNKIIQSERLASLGKMAAGIAHEVNNPLGGILVLSSLVVEKLTDDDPNKQNLEEVVKQTIRCRDIVKGLLQFSRETAAKKSLVNINIILNSTLALIERQAIFHNIEVEKNLADDLPLIMVDDSQFQQVFMNIIFNAAHEMNTIGILTIKSFFDQHNKMININISDTGKGIPPEIIDKIFDPFFTTKDVGEGTGLGLSIAYGIVTKHNGKMFVKSEVNIGTTFTIQIPVPENY